MPGQLGRRVGDPVVDRAVAYLRRSQQADGSWFGRWGVNYIYGTWQSLTGLGEVGVQPDDPAVVAGANWLLAHQQPDGGWGESPDSYDDPQLRGQGPPTASQTAWAVLGLLAAGLAGASGHRSAASATCSAPSAATAPGTRPSSPAPAFRGSSTCATTTIPFTSP